MAEQTSQWRGLRATQAGHWFNSRIRSRKERSVVAKIRGHVDKDGVILDVGAGTGFFTLAVAPLLDGGKVIALDASPDMLAGLERRAAAKHLSNRIDTVVADAADTGLPESSVDLVISGNVLHELPDPGAAVREMARVLRTGGHVAIQDFHDGIVGRLMKVLHHHEAHGPLGTRAIRAHLQAAGFSDVEVTTSGVRYLATGRKNGTGAATRA